VSLKLASTVASSIASMLAGLPALGGTLLLYRNAWEAAKGDAAQELQLSGWESAVFRLVFCCLMLAAVSAMIVTSAWLARRLGGSVRGAVLGTLFLIGVAAWPVLIYASAVNCGAMEGFPLPFDCD